MPDKKPDINITNWNVDELKENYDNLSKKMEARINNLDQLTANVDKYISKLNADAKIINEEKKEEPETEDLTANFPADKTKFNVTILLPVKEGSEFLKWISDKKEYEIKEFKLV